MRWSDKSIFTVMMAGLAADRGGEKAMMIDATYLKAHRTTTSLAVAKRACTPDRPHKGGMNTKLHATCDSP